MRITPKVPQTKIYQIPRTGDKPTSDVWAAAWQDNVAYAIGDVCAVGAVLYYALYANNPDPFNTPKNPVTEPAYWSVLPLPPGTDGDFAYGSPTDGESRRQVNTDGTITDFALGVDYPINPATMDIVNGTGVATPKGTWDAGINYVTGDMVKSGAVVYIAKVASIDVEPGVDAGWETSWGITTWATSAGEWDATIAYVRGHTTWKAGTKYLSLLAGTNKDPATEADYWAATTVTTPAFVTHKARTWPVSLVACKDLNWNGTTDWRLPNSSVIQHLASDYSTCSNYTNNPCVKYPSFINDPPSVYYWTASRAPVPPMTYAMYWGSTFLELQRGIFGVACVSRPIRPTSAIRTPTVFNDPYSGVANWTTIIHAKAALHTHTDESDVTVGAEHAAAAPHDQIDAYHAVGYKVLSLTDHNTQTPWPWTALHDVNEAYENRDPATLEMVAIQGNERTDSSRGWHQVMMFSTYNTSDTSGNTILGSVVGGGFSRIAHPIWTGNVTWYNLIIYLYNLTYDAGLHGIEIINSTALGDVLNPFVEEGRTGADIALWDKILTYTMPYRPIWGYCVDDSHILGPEIGEMEGPAYTVILVDELTDAKVKAALVAGQFYGVSGGTPPTLTSVVHDSVNKAITITASGWTGIDWISEGNVVANGNVLHYGFLDSIKSYVRARVKNATGDLWLQPVAFNMLH